MKTPIGTEQFIEEASEDFRQHIAQTGDALAPIRFINLLQAISQHNWWRGFWTGAFFVGGVIGTLLLVTR